MKKLTLFTLLFATISPISMGPSPFILAEEREGSGSFLPVWKLLTLNEKQQFISGYLQGWRDAALVTDIAINYVKKNPERAIASLEGIKVLYRLKNSSSSQIVEAIDEFYADPENQNAPLSRAVTAARSKGQ
jgi:hypothetical protein